MSDMNEIKQMLSSLTQQMSQRLSLLSTKVDAMENKQEIKQPEVKPMEEEKVHEVQPGEPDEGIITELFNLLKRGLVRKPVGNGNGAIAAAPGVGGNGGMSRYYYLNSQYIENFIPASDYAIASQLHFIDRNTKWMGWRGGTLPRDKAFYTDPLQGRCLIYSYSGYNSVQVIKGYRPLSESQFLMNLRDLIKQRFGHPTNHVIATRYNNGGDNINYHRDDGHSKKKPSLHPDTPIFMITLGAERDLSFMDDATNQVTNIRLKPGSLFILGPKTNHAFRHALLEDKSCTAPRISLIFRNVIRSEPYDAVLKQAQQCKGWS